MSTPTSEIASVEKPSPAVTFWAQSAASVRAWAAVAAAFFGVVAVALFLFDHYRRDRAAEIDAQLGQNAARLGQEVEVKYQNYRLVVDNVTRMMSSAGLAAAALRHNTLEAAKSASDEAKKQEVEFKDFRDTAARRDTDARNLASLASTMTADAAVTEQALDTSYQNAKQSVTTALLTANQAIDSFTSRAPTVVDAQRDFDQRTRDVEAAQRVLDALPAPSADGTAAATPATAAGSVPQAPVSSATPPTSASGTPVSGAPAASASGSQSTPAAALTIPPPGTPAASKMPATSNMPAPPGTPAASNMPAASSAPAAQFAASIPPTPSVTSERDSALAAVKRAVGARTNAQNALERVRAEFDDARRLAASAVDDLNKKDLRAREAFAQWASAVQAYIDASHQAKGAGDQKEQADTIAANASTAVKVLHNITLQLGESVNGAQHPSDSNVVSDFLSALRTVVLPSQVALLDDCKRAQTLDDAQLCVARNIAKISNEVEGLEMVRCPSQSIVPTLVDDGRFLMIPPSEAGGQSTDRDESPAQGAAVEPPLPACGRVKVARFLAGADPSLRATMAGSGDGVFEAVFLLRSDGTTLHSLELGSNLRMSALPDFQAKYADASGMLTNIKLGTSAYRAFLQPIRLRLSTRGKDGAPLANDSREHTDLLVCGLAREDRLQKASYTLSLPSYLWVVLLLGFGLLSLPLAKLWLLGPKTNFTAFDVTMLATSALLLTLLGAVVLLGFVAHNRLGARADEQIADVGANIAGRLSSEISSAASTLSAFNESRETGSVRGMLADTYDSRTSAAQRQACIDARGALVDGISFDGEGPTRSVCERTHFDFGIKQNWRLIYFMDTAGNERVEFTPKPYGSTPASLKKRDYFKRALQNDTACVGAGNKPCTIRGVPQLVRSVISGTIELIVAQPVCTGSSPCSPAESPIGVSAIETDMDPFRSLALPLGMQAAVIDESGHIMLHSNNDAHHEQDVFSEVSDPDELHATLAARVTQTVTLSYLGQLSRVHVEPLRLPGTGWSVLTIAPASIVDGATTDIVLATLLAYGIWVGAIILAVCCWLVARQAYDWIWKQDPSEQAHDHDRAVSLRPRASNSRTYATLGLFAIRSGTILCLVSVFLTPAVPTSLGIVAASVICWRAAKLLPRGVAMRREVTGNSWQDRLPLTYLLCIAGLAQVFVMAPATVFFSGAYDYVVDDLVRAEHDHYAAIFRGHAKCVETVGTPASKEPSTLGCADNAVVFASSEEPATEHALAASLAEILRGRLLSPMPYFADLLPRVCSTDGEDSGRLYRDETIGRSEPSPAQYASTRGPIDVHLSSLIGGDRRLLLSSPLPFLMSVHYHWLNLIALILISAAALATTYALGFYSLRRLFFLDLLREWREPRPDPNALLSELTAHDRISRKILVNYPSKEVRALFENHPQACGLDLRGAVYEPPAGHSPGSFWLVRNLEISIADASAAERLLEVSEWSRPVIVLSDVDPVRSAPASVRRAWAIALENFESEELRVPAAVPTETHETEAKDQQKKDSSSPATIARWWLDSDDDERRILGQLAIGGYVTPHPANEAALKALAARGLLDTETMTVKSKKLERYAHQSISPQDQAAWAEADSGTAWMALRVPLSTGVVALLAAVTMAKPELGAASAIVPTLTAGLPTVLRVLTQMLSPKGG